MSNAYFMTGKLDRKFLRCSAVYRCLKRYGVGKKWAIAKIQESGISENLATATVEQWLQTKWFQDQARPNLFNWKKS